MNPNWNWGPAWRKLRDDVNLLAWLFAEHRHHCHHQPPMELWIGKASSSTDQPPT